MRSECTRREFLNAMTVLLTGAAGVTCHAAEADDNAQHDITESPQNKENQGKQERRMTRFGIQIEPQFGFTFSDIADLAKEAERLGFTALWASDHLLWDAKSERRNCLDVWALMPALAAVTTKLRIGTLVTCNSYRLPSVLAKTAACVDHISNGRLEFGLGAGWKDIEYKAYGIPFPPVATRLAQLEEAAQLIKLLWTEERASFNGKHYRLDD